jgi:NAD(P)-dependent dehydrogenase (short-subunit alcohol dehydrogenase family)
VKATILHKKKEIGLLMNTNIRDLFDLTGKVALVTGSGSGIGKAIAIAMGEAGASVVCADINNHTAKETVSEIRSEGVSAISLEVDVSREMDVKRMVSKALHRYDRIDSLFCIAGVAHAPAMLHQFPKEEWDKILSVNLTGTFHCCKEVLKVLVGQRAGKIITMSSTIYNRGSEAGKAAGMCATKGAVSVMTKDMAVAYAPYGIQINAIAPGPFKTNIGNDLFKGLNYEEISARIFKDSVQKIPIGRIGIPDDIKGAAVFLASSASDYITGHILVVDGGRTAK